MLTPVEATTAGLLASNPAAGAGRRQPQPHLVLEHVRRRIDQHVQRPPQRDPQRRLIRCLALPLSHGS
jgi:hypothetical protein